MKRYLILALFAAAPFSVFSTGCNKVVPVPDAGLIVVDATAAVDTSDAGTTAATDLDASLEAAAPLATVLPTAHPTAHVATGGPFQGNFNCNAQTTQAGNVLTGHFKGNAFTCTISGEVCDGHIQPNNHHFTFKKNGSGDLTYNEDGQRQGVFCKKQ